MPIFFMFWRCIFMIKQKCVLKGISRKIHICHIRHWQILFLNYRQRKMEFLPTSWLPWFSATTSFFNLVYLLSVFMSSSCCYHTPSLLGFTISIVPKLGCHAVPWSFRNLHSSWAHNNTVQGNTQVWSCSHLPT